MSQNIRSTTNRREKNIHVEKINQYLYI